MAKLSCSYLVSGIRNLACMDIRQSKQYARYMQLLNWNVERVGSFQAYIKSFPFIGSFIKIQRIGNPIPWRAIQRLGEKHHAFRTIIEFDKSESAQTGCNGNSKQKEPRLAPPSNFRRLNTPFSPTKTIYIDLTPRLNTILVNFRPTARHAIRKAEKNGVHTEFSDNIETFIKLKSKNPIDRLLLRNEVRSIWKAFYPTGACIVFALPPATDHVPTLDKRRNQTRYQQSTTDPVAGVLLLFHENTAHYWLAASTKKGNSLYAPSLVVWEAVKRAKQRKCRAFDFEGVCDPRFEKETRSWKGFTRFKKGFGGNEVLYPEPVYF